MPSAETLLIFTVAAILMNLSPGPSNFYVMSRSIAQATATPSTASSERNGCRSSSRAE